MRIAAVIRQTWALIGLNLRGIPARPGASLVAVIGVAAVVGVFAAVLSMAAGFERTMQSAGSASVAVVMREGATTEMNSGLTYEQTQIIANAPGLAADTAGPLASAELYVVVDLPKKATNTSANVPLRGVQPAAYGVRTHFELLAGRAFEPGRNELIVGRAAQSQFAGLELGTNVRFGGSNWTIVGVFASGGGVEESEIWCDARVLQPAYRRGNSFQSVRARLVDPGALDTFARALARDARLQVDVLRESDYYAQQSQSLTEFIRLIGYPIAILMAIGAIFGALNTMYSSVAARTREIATLRALGFGPVSVATATIVESMVLALAGGLLGAAIAYLGFNGYTASTLNGASFSQVVFAFAVTPALLLQGLLGALMIGCIGGLLPAVRAARLPVIAALREL